MAYDEAIRAITVPADASIGFYTGVAGALGSPVRLVVPAGLALVTGGTPGTTHYSYRVSALSAAGETVPCAEVTITTGAAALTGTDCVTVSWTPVPGAVAYNVYGRTLGAEKKIATVTAATYKDDGSVVTPAGAPPTHNMSGSNSGKQYCWCKITGLQSLGLAVGSVNEIPDGILYNKPPAVGAAATLVIRGVAISVAGETFAGGEPVKVGADSRSAVGVAGTDHIVGKAMSAGAAGELISVLLKV
jgi:hypothetical protein